MTGLEELGQFAVTLAPGGAWDWLECAAAAGVLAAAVAVPWHEAVKARRARRRYEHLPALPPPLAEERRDGLLSPGDAQKWAAVERRLRNDGMGRAVAARVVRTAGTGRRRARTARTRARTGKS